MQAAPAGIWTRFAVSISNDDNLYTINIPVNIIPKNSDNWTFIYSPTFFKIGKYFCIS